MSVPTRDPASEPRPASEPPPAPGSAARPEPAVQSSLARVVTPGGKVFQGLTVAGAGSAVTLDFPLDDCPALPLGRELRLEFPHLGVGAPIALAAVTVYRGQDEHRRRYRFEIQRSVGRAVAAMINRRSALRVRPEPGTSIAVRVRGLGAEAAPAEVECELFDLSLTGASLRLAPGQDAGPFAAERVQLSFRLPGADEPIETEGLVRHRTLDGPDPRYGLEFAPAEGQDAHELEQRLTGWVTERQAELLREAHGAPAAGSPRR